MVDIKYNEEYDTIIRDWVINHPRSYFKKVKAKNNTHILKYIEQCTPLLSDSKYLISTKIYWVINKIQEFPKCKVCGKPILKNIKINEGYPTHCSAQCLSDDPDVLKHKQESYEKRFGSGIINPFQSTEIIKKIEDTNIRKYGVKRYTQTSYYKSFLSEHNEEFSKKRRTTNLINSSFNESKPEQVAYSLLKRKYPDLIHQYTSKLYPFNCDFYSPSNDLYIEFNGTWTHGGHPFDATNKQDIEQLEFWKQNSNKPFYKNAIYTWTDLDVRKRECAKNNNLNYLIFWNLNEIYNHVIQNYNNILQVKTLVLPYRRNTLLREFDFYKNTKCPSFNPFVSTRNEIVKYFQQDIFFKSEREIWNNDITKRCKLIENRIKYLNKSIENLNHNDILNGFKRSGIYYGYSHFNPMWFKWFIEHFNIKTCYDPTGGWGHRLLGALNLNKYIYNDLSTSTKNNVDDIIRFFNITNTVTYNQNAITFEPPEHFEAMFTCPPYYNIEEYECEKFSSFEEFNTLIQSMFDLFYRRPDCRLFGLVLREDLLIDHNDYIQKILINVSSNNKYLSGTKKNNKEFLFIYQK